MPSGSSPRCPYPGFRAFQAADADVFFGRDDEIADILKRLHRQKLLVIIGPSGSGKSSLVRAGVVPRLATSAYWPAGHWQVIAMQPGFHPLAALATHGAAILPIPLQPSPPASPASPALLSYSSSLTSSRKSL